MNTDKTTLRTGCHLVFHYSTCTSPGAPTTGTHTHTLVGWVFVFTTTSRSTSCGPNRARNCPWASALSRYLQDTSLTHTTTHHAFFLICRRQISRLLRMLLAAVNLQLEFLCLERQSLPCCFQVLARTPHPARWRCLPVCLPPFERLQKESPFLPRRWHNSRLFNFRLQGCESLFF